MGKRGPKPAPTGLKLVTGARKSRIPQDQPPGAALDRLPRHPDWLSVEARRYWRRIGRELVESGRLNADNADAFAMCCEAMARHERACRVLDDPEVDRFPRNAAGTLTRHPALLEAKEAAASALRFAQEFGLTPAARSTVKMPAPIEGAEADALMS